LGDEHAVPGFRWGQERGNARMVTGVDAAYRLPIGVLARTRLRVGAVGDGLGDLGGSGRWVTGLELGALWSTPFGALSAGAGINTGGGRLLVLSVGPQF
ncbi:MAG: hypothetical protein M3P24_12170, partial [Gemmatimonadota bacterium]|nr:hypothetical protein [Gemmatimonadota bacterium]